MRLISVLVAATVSVGPLTAFLKSQSLADVAKQEAQRRTTLTQPSTVYTNDDLVRFSRPSDAKLRSVNSGTCELEERPADQSGNRFSVERCTNGKTNFHGSNARTGSKWQWTVFSDGSQEGFNSCGVTWTYDSKTTVYKNSNGEMRRGEGEFRQILEEPMRCQPDSVISPPGVPLTGETGTQDKERERVKLVLRCGDPKADPYHCVNGGLKINGQLPPKETPEEIARRKSDIENGKTGGAIHPCGNRFADPNRCMENGQLKQR